MLLLRVKVIYFEEIYKLDGGILMKNYSLNFKDSQTFILNYSVKDNQLIVHLASGDDWFIPYTLENEKNLLERMKYQVLNSKKFIKKICESYSSCQSGIISNGVRVGACVFLVIVGNVIIDLLFEPLALIFGSCIIEDVCKMIYWRSYGIDILKNKMFIDNEELLNKKVRLNSNILFNINEKTKKLISSTPEGEPVFSLNNMDKFKYSELKKILENIKRDEQFGFDYSSILEENPTQRTRKRK